jgi:hypothetical protein
MMEDGNEFGFELMKLSIGVQGFKQQTIKKVRVAVRGTRK